MSKAKCSVDGCEKEAHTKGKCRKHYVAYIRTDPIRPRCIQCKKEAASVRSLCQRCYDRARASGVGLPVEITRGRGIRFLTNIDPTDECILWPYRIDGRGYGKVIFNGHNRTAHSVSLELRVPKPFLNAHALHISHLLCGHRRCVNPRHLKWGTNDENMADMVLEGTSAKKLTKTDVHTIYSLLTAGLSQKSIANIFDVSLSAFSKIATGKSWGHTTGITRQSKS